MAAPTIIPKSSYYDGVVTESDRAAGRAGAPDFTVYGADDLRLSAHPTIPFALVVKKGKASAFGVTTFVESSTGADLVVQCDSQTSGTRWDIVTLRYDWRPDLGGPTDIRAMNAGGKQIPTNLEKTPGRLVDQPVWLVRWTGSSSTPAEYVDLRCFAGNGGMMANDTLALGYLAKPGACVKIGPALWRYEPQGNSVWGWNAYHAGGGTSYSLTSFFATTITDGSEVGIALLTIPDPGIPYRVKAVAGVPIYADSAAGVEVKVRLDSISGPQLGALGLRPAGTASGLGITVTAGTGGISERRTGPTTVVVTARRVYGSGPWAVAAGGNALGVDLIFS